MDVGDCADAFLHCIETMDDRINLVNLGSVDTCSVTRSLRSSSRPWGWMRASNTRG